MVGIIRLQVWLSNRYSKGYHAPCVSGIASLVMISKRRLCRKHRSLAKVTFLLPPIARAAPQSEFAVFDPNTEHSTSLRYTHMRASRTDRSLSSDGFPKDTR